MDLNDKEKLMIKVRNDECPICKSKRSLEGYDMKDKPVRFTLFIDGNNLERLKYRALSYLKCRRCRNVFKIDWDDNGEPYPLSKQKMDDFITKYNNINKL